MSRAGPMLVALAILAMVLPATPAGALAGAPIVRVTSTLDTVQPLEPVTGATSANMRALRGEFESFQLIIGGPGGDALTGVDVAPGTLAGPGGASIPARNVVVYAQKYTRIWTPSDQEGLDEQPSLDSYDRGWCQWFGNVTGATCGIPVDRTDGDDTPYNTTWRCGGATAPVIDERHCLVPDALVPRNDAFTGERREKAFPFAVPPGENRAVWVEVLVPAGAAAGTYNGAVTVTAAGDAAPVAVPVSLKVLPVTLPAFGTQPALDLQGGVRATISQYCAAMGCPADRNELARGYSMFVRSALEHRLPLTTVAPFQPAAGAPRTAFDRWIAPYFNGSAATATDALMLPPRLPDVRQKLVLLDHWAARAEWGNWVDALDAAGSLGALSYYCDEYMTSQVSFNQYCAGPYADNAVPAWPAGEGKPGAMLIGSQAQFDTAKNWGYDITTNANRIVPNMAFHLHRRGTVDTRPSYDTGFLTKAGREVWGYDSNNSLGANEDWSIHSTYNGYPVLGGVDQPATSERGIGITSWSYRLQGHFYYEALHRFADAWNSCKTTPNACLYDYFGGHGDGTLFYPGTPARIGGTTAIPVESIRLKRYRDGSEDYTALRLLETGCGGACTPRTRAELAAVVGSTEAAGAEGLMPRMWQTSVGAAAFEHTRATYLDLFPQGDDDVPPPPDGVDLAATSTALRAPAGPNFSYEVTVTNNGPNPSMGSTLYEQIPAGSALISTGATWCQDFGDGIRACGIGPLAVGESSTARFVVRPGSEGPLQNWAKVEGGDQDLNSGNEVTTTDAGPSLICDVLGTANADSMVGTERSEVLCGLGGNDLLLGGRGNDLLFGGAGSDTVRYARSPHAMIVNLNFQRSTAEGAWPRHDGQSGHGRDHFASIERAMGSAYDDFLLGRTANADRLSGGRGPDLVYGYGGRDTLSGGRGRDVLHGGEDLDVVKGGDGSDLCRDLTDSLRSCER